MCAQYYPLQHGNCCPTDLVPLLYCVVLSTSEFAGSDASFSHFLQENLTKHIEKKSLKWEC